ncbi:MAG: hypothetical protein ACJ8F4_05915 [Sphingomonas sp.]
MLFITLLAAAAPTGVTGLYQAQQMEVGAALELQKNGHFRYQLDYGAVSEQAEGDWTFDGKTVRLTSKPMPKPPSFELLRDDPAPEGQLTMTVEPPGFGADYRIDAVAVDATTGEKGMVTTDSDGRVESGGRSLRSLDPLVPVYGNIGGHFALSPDRGHHLVLRFHANDLGRAAFDGEELQLTSRGLVFSRYDAEIRFVRVGP